MPSDETTMWRSSQPASAAGFEPIEGNSVVAAAHAVDQRRTFNDSTVSGKRFDGAEKRGDADPAGDPQRRSAAFGKRSQVAVRPLDQHPGPEKIVCLQATRPVAEVSDEESKIR